MKIENLSFLTELTDEDASYVNGGSDSIFDDLIIGIPTPIYTYPNPNYPRFLDILDNNCNDSSRVDFIKGIFGIS
ncbi:hypothetical protein IQ230_04465 [Gloeocapsopsis crepidinum LEGE 06123]|uniref:Uncharacterized protein n=1 Tax=Gloeocapsopsis crepidinum LEGE 06123 TaxID=588587 RepID=A0ABR9UMZ5_9CHRO|nr:hypothetical protein [Gloeocapsopsis crepidinum]MBE9189629.1 hypothetical protein [Gloeocapsopsis crepidinum LEGE 06123]